MSRDTGRGGGANVFHRTAAVDPGGKRGARSPGQAQGSGELSSLHVDIDGVDAEEFAEFMEGDWLDVKADPTFRERLRARLWQMLRDRHSEPESD